DEIRLGAARLGDVESCQPDGHGHDIEVTEDPGGAARAGKLDLIHQESRGDPEAHDVHQTVQLGAEPRPRAREPGHAPVQGVENPGEHDEPRGAVEVAAGGQHHRPDAEEQVEEREQTGHHDHDPPHLQHRGSHRGYSASTLPPTRTRSPGLTLSAARADSGRKMSVREPNRIIPRRAPCAAGAPGRPSVTMRRATDPAICRTSTRPRGPFTPIDACSLSRLAFSLAAWRNLPGL